MKNKTYIFLSAVVLIAVVWAVGTLVSSNINNQTASSLSLDSKSKVSDSEIPFFGTYHGMVRVDWQTSPDSASKYVDELTWFARSTGSDNVVKLGVAKSSLINGVYIWGFIWDTEEFENGDYVLIPEIKTRNSIDFGDGRRRVTVKNEVGLDTDRFLLDASIHKTETYLAKQKELEVTQNRENEQNSADTLVENELDLSDLIYKKPTRRDEVLLGRVENKGFRDFDGDGLTDYDEVYIYKTDPDVADSDNDGIKDGVEIMSGSSPKDSDIDKKIEYESPKGANIESSEMLTVENVEVSETVKTETEDKKVTRIKITGKAMPNIFVTLYVYSTPIVVVVKTNENGDWVYELDKELEDGQHEVYVAVTDSVGDIFVQSAPLLFVKEASAITINTDLGFSDGSTTSFFDSKYVMFVSLILIAGIIFGLMFIGRRKSNIE